MWNCPINGSQVNSPAKLYKRFTGEVKVTAEKSAEVITIEDNRYASYYSFAYIEADDMTQADEQPLDGLPVNSARMTVKFHGRWKPVPRGKDEPEEGDVLEINGEYWIIEAGIQRVRKKSLVDFATVFLPIRRLM